MKLKYLLGLSILLGGLFFTSCGQQSSTSQVGLSEQTIQAAVDSACLNAPKMDKELMARGIHQAAALWTDQDGTPEEFIQFVKENMATTPEAKEALFQSMARALEQLYEASDRLTIELDRPTTLSNAGEPTSLDYMWTAYNSMAHFSDDMFTNKIAFICILNFPHYTLEEKNTLGKKWTHHQWAMARLGDYFTDRVPSEVSTQKSEASASGNAYVDTYNIYMGHLLNDKGQKLWPEDKVLLDHWNLRDELKANYADLPNAHEKQEMIYQVMMRIIRQEIPEGVINSGEYDWAPYSNEVSKDGKKVSMERENDVRYQHVIDIFHSFQAEDKYCPSEPTAILRHFNSSLELPDEEVEKLFVELVSSPQVKKVAALIKERLGRDLRPYDIWYDGFKSRSAFDEDKLTEQTRKLYPNAEGFHQDMPRMLREFGFSAEEAQFLADHIVVEPARGSGHAWGTAGHDMPARLRTRIGDQGMDYKGYNIAVHEFGHNVEQVTSMYHNDEWMLYGVPNDGFTEASAFMFQQRDLQLLGYGKQDLDDNTTLDMFWNMYEIMGVSLVDIRMWHWLYEHPDATAATLREAVIQIGAEVWNQYYAPVLGEKDSPLLCVYQHMIDYPMYLPGYPLGHLIHYQLEKHFGQYTNPADLAKEYQRIYSLGRLTPDVWMEQAVGTELSVKPVLEAVDQILAR